MPLVDVITTSFVRLRILSTLSRKISNRDVGRSFSSRQWTWMIPAPSCSHRYAVSAISSGVTGTWGVSFFRGTEPVGATVMMSLSMPSARARYASIRSKGLWRRPVAHGHRGAGLGEEVARHLHVRGDPLQLRLREFVQRNPDATVHTLDALNRLQPAELLCLPFDNSTDRRLGVRGEAGIVKASGESAWRPANRPSSGVPAARSFSSTTTSSAVQPHRSKATGHRGWNRHPGGMSEGSGRSPFRMMRFRRRSGSGTGTTDTSAFV